MSAAHIDTERLTQSAGGGAPLSHAEAAHVAGCAECRLELRIFTAARKLGSAEIARLDLTDVAAEVGRRLRGTREPERSPRRVGRWIAVLAAAAAVVIAVYTGTPRGSGLRSDAGAATSVESVLHELDDLSAPELEEVLQSIPPAIDGLSHGDLAPLADLNASDLERMLRSMEER